jgi:hypothetical protein
LGVIVELDGELWVPVPGAAVTAEEFIAARSLIQEIHRSLWWNPWWMTDRRAVYDAAWEACRQWTRADPGPDLSSKTVQEYEAELAQKLAGAEARAGAKREQAERDRAERAGWYDPGRAQARLALLEEQGMLADKVRERNEIISREIFPGMGDEQRDRHLAALEAKIGEGERAVEELAAVVGDPETVCDERGWLPAERRELSLTLFKERREAEIRQLRARIPARQAELKTLTGRAERAKQREQLRTDLARLASLEAMPPMQASGMCSECVNPAWHSPGVTYNLSDMSSTGGPCPAWPRWAQQVEMLRRALRERPARLAEPPAPKPSPIAVIAAGAPIEDVIAKLTAIQVDHPGAAIRQGKRNRLEIWPPGTRPAHQRHVPDTAIWLGSEPCAPAKQANHDAAGRSDDAHDDEDLG